MNKNDFYERLKDLRDSLHELSMCDGVNLWSVYGFLFSAESSLNFALSRLNQFVEDEEVTCDGVKTLK